MPLCMAKAMTLARPSAKDFDPSWHFSRTELQYCVKRSWTLEMGETGSDWVGPVDGLGSGTAA